MKLVIETKEKITFFISLFQQLKLFTKTLCIFFNDDNIYIQGMDASHVCLYEAKLHSKWFYYYKKKETDHGMICLDPSILSNVLSMTEDGFSVEFFYEGEPDILDIHICKRENVIVGEKKCDYDKHFGLPLIDYECEIMNIPESEHDAQFSLPSKKICELTSQLAVFGDELKIHCSEKEIVLGTSGDLGTMQVNIRIDDLSDFTINEGEEYTLSFSLMYVHKFCLTSKLTPEVQFSITDNNPLRIRYEWEENFIMFFIAPKMDD